MHRTRKRDIAVAPILMGKILDRYNYRRKNATGMSRDHILLKDKGVDVYPRIWFFINGLGNYEVDVGIVA
jgi:hypothetical protein